MFCPVAGAERPLLKFELESCGATWPNNRRPFLCNGADILQDVIFEEVDDFIAGEDRGFLKAHRPVAERKEAVVKTMDPQVEVMVYLECLQRLLKAQLDVIVKWFGSKAYEGVLKQIWKLVVLQSGLLNVGHLKA